MDIKSHYHLLMAEIYNSMGLSEPEESEVHSFAIAGNDALHIQFQPNTESVVFTRMLDQRVDNLEPGHYCALLGLNGFTDEPVKKGVFVDSSDHILFWVQSPIEDLDLARAREIIEELTVESPIPE